MAKYGMVIDLHSCVGCGGCDLACKSENNTPDDINWASHTVETSGKWPNVKYTHRPTLCNHCEDAPCVKVCPTQAMHKDENGMTVHDPSKCIGCKSCMLADPYGVIHFNKKTGFIEWGSDDSTIVKGGTTSKKELAQMSNAPFPYFNVERGADGYEAIRGQGAVEKCTFCNHRVKKGMMPHCVESCPSEARIFGDLDDANSNINQLLNAHKAEVLMPEKGTKPKVFYIRSYN